MSFEIVYNFYPAAFSDKYDGYDQSCGNEGALDFLEQYFVLTEEEKRAVLQQKVIFWTNAMAEDLRREIDTPPSVVEHLMTNWTDEEKCRFNEDWANDEFLSYDEEVEQLSSPIEEALESQVGEGSKRKHVSDGESPSKRHTPEVILKTREAVFYQI